MLVKQWEASLKKLLILEVLLALGIGETGKEKYCVFVSEGFVVVVVVAELDLENF